MTRERLRILYIDDDAGLRRLVQRELQRLGCEVEVAANGGSGLALLSKTAFDAIALDHMMPEMNGLETLAAIRKLASPPPVVFVTGAAESRIAVAALKAGAADYVVKDVEGHFIALIKVAVENALEADQLRRAKEAAEVEMRAARDRFEALAAEREILLREVNHRVSNSLQLISSMLQVQANASPSEETREALLRATARVLAISEVHRRLYNSSDAKTVLLDQYLGALIEDLGRSSDTMERPQLILNAEAITFGSDQAVALGVIVNELAINAWKHAYPGGSGPIRIRLERRPDGTAQLSVEDDGVGANATPVIGSAGLGKRIVTAMAHKLGAEVEQESSPSGTRVTVTFALGDAANCPAA